MRHNGVHLFIDRRVKNHLIIRIHQLGAPLIADLHWLDKSRKLR